MSKCSWKAQSVSKRLLDVAKSRYSIRGRRWLVPLEKGKSWWRNMPGIFPKVFLNFYQESLPWQDLGAWPQHNFLDTWQSGNPASIFTVELMYRHQYFPQGTDQLSSPCPLGIQSGTLVHSYQICHRIHYWTYQGSVFTVPRFPEPSPSGVWNCIDVSCQTYLLGNTSGLQGGGSILSNLQAHQIDLIDAANDRNLWCRNILMTQWKYGIVRLCVNGPGE